jgi:hypothetical protein
VKTLLAVIAALWAGLAQATVTTTTTSSSYTCDGSTTVFTIGFPYAASADLAVTNTNLSGSVLNLALGTDYTVTGGGTSVTTTGAASPCGNGNTLKIIRNTPITQGTSFRTQGAFSPRSHEAAFDRLTMIAQELFIPQQSYSINDNAAITATHSTQPRLLRDRFADTINVKDYGAKGDGTTDDTAAVQGAWAAAEAAGTGLEFPQGNYSVNTIALGSAVSTGIRVRGAGPTRTIITSRSGSHVFEITGKSVWAVNIKDLSIQGAAGAGHGIYIHDNNFPVFNVRIENVRIANMGGHGIFIPQGFNLQFENVIVTGCGDDLIEVLADVSASFTNVYVAQVAASHYGWHVYAGHPVFIGCNGIDSNSPDGASWGKFGRTVAEDGVASQSFPIFIGTNFEDFRKYGVRFVNASTGSFYSSTFVAPLSNTGAIRAIQFEDNAGAPTVFGELDAISTITSKGITYENGQPIHVTTNVGVPLVSKMATVLFWNDSAAAAQAIIGVITPTASIGTLYGQNPGSSVQIQGRAADSGATVANQIGNVTPLTASGAKIVGFYSDGNSTLKASVDKDGGFTGSAVHADTINSQVGGNTLTLLGRVGDSGSAHAIALQNSTPLTTTGAMAIDGFSDSGSTRIWAIRKNASTWGLRLKSPDGTWYLLTIANGGTVSIAADP